MVQAGMNAIGFSGAYIGNKVLSLTYYPEQYKRNAVAG